MKKVFCLAFSLFCSGVGLFAQYPVSSQFQPCLSVFMGEDIFSNEVRGVINGSEKISPHNGNDLSQLLTGFSLTNKFHFGNNIVLQTGICYSNFTTSDFNVITFNVSLNGLPASLSCRWNLKV